MTLSTAVDLFANETYLINEISGELVIVENGTTRTLIHGDSKKPEVMCQMLFNEQQVNVAWNVISENESHARFQKYWDSIGA